jgi:predicted transcriptional regulator YdeE
MIHSNNVETSFFEKISVSGISCKLTKSYKENFKLISSGWKSFNKTLYTHGLSQAENWKKFGISYKVNEQYFYFIAIPYAENSSLQSFIIDAGQYATFEHLGNLNKLPETLNSIYLEKLPNSEVKIDTNRILLHYELYNHRFNWNHENSHIDIIIPLIEG